MSRDIYPSLSGAMATWRQMDQITNNMSNMNTVGYKGRRVPFENYMQNEGLLGDGYTRLGELKVDFSDGTAVRDNVNTHFVIRGEGFFSVQNDTEQLLMRSGNFQMDANGFLVNSMGEKVMGRSGPIQFPQEQLEFSVTNDGRILDEEGFELDQIVIVNGQNLEPLANSRWRAEQVEDVTGTVQIEQGALESSNVDGFRSMIQMIEASRFLETYQKAIHTSDMMDAYINQMTRRS